MYIAKQDIYTLIRSVGGAWNDGKERLIYIIKNKSLIAELEYKLSRILGYEKSNPNCFRQRITDVKEKLLEDLPK